MSDDPLTFSYFAGLCENLKGTSSKNEKIRILGDYLLLLDDDSLRIACTFLSGRSLNPNTGLELNVGYSLLLDLLESISKVTRNDLVHTYLRYGDIGVVAEHAIRNINAKPLVGVRLTLKYVYAQFICIAEQEGKHSLSRKRSILAGLFLNVSPQEAKYLAKIIAGELRIGVVDGILEHVIAYAFKKDNGIVEDAYIACNNLAEVAVHAKHDTLDAIQVRPSKPIAFMLADTDSKYHPKLFIIEYKYDGIRAQVHKCGDEVRVFSRGIEDVTSKFPEIVEGISNIPNDLILDGEIVAFKDGRILPFNILQSRLLKKGNVSNKDDINARYFVFDILYYNGSLIKRSLMERKSILSSMCISTKGIEVAWYTIASDESIIPNILKVSIEKGYEGLMIKDALSYYKPGRSKHWIKVKGIKDTIDVVIVAAEYGHGKRAGLLSDYTFAVRDFDSLKIIGKAYTGLSDDEIKELTLRLKAIALKDEGFRVIVKPSIVVEVEYDSIVRSSRYDSGYALRFPRIKAIRYDKGIEDIDTLEKVKSLAK